MPYREVAGILNDVGYRRARSSGNGLHHRPSAHEKHDDRRSEGRRHGRLLRRSHRRCISSICFRYAVLAATFSVTGDAIADIQEDMAAEQKARLTYDNILRMADDPDVIDPIRFLREREIVHYQRFGEGLRFIQDKLDSKNFYAINPEFDMR